MNNIDWKDTLVRANINELIVVDPGNSALQEFIDNTFSARE